MVRFKIEMQSKEIGGYSLNKLYSTSTHWTIRKRQADFIHSLVQSTLYMNKVPRKPFKSPVKVCIYYNSKLDIDNHSYLSKLIIDGLKGYLIEDDKRKYVVELDQKFYDKDGILVEVEEIFLNKNVKE